MKSLLKGAMVFIIPRVDIENIELDKLVSSIDKKNHHANHNRFWGNGETWGYVGANCAFTIRHSFHGGIDQRESVGRVFLDEENLDKALKEYFSTLLSRKSFLGTLKDEKGMLCGRAYNSDILTAEERSIIQQNADDQLGEIWKNVEFMSPSEFRAR